MRTEFQRYLFGANTGGQLDMIETIKSIDVALKYAAEGDKYALQSIFSREPHLINSKNEVDFILVDCNQTALKNISTEWIVRHPCSGTKWTSFRNGLLAQNWSRDEQFFNRKFLLNV